VKAIARVAIGVGDNRTPAMRGLLFPKIIIFDSALLLQVRRVAYKHNR
jgi:hypothetical protein